MQVSPHEVSRERPKSARGSPPRQREMMSVMVLPAVLALTMAPMGAIHHAPLLVHRAPLRLSRPPQCLFQASDKPRLPKVSIEYCTRCNWMLRSVWLQQELLTTFNGTLAEVSLLPNHEGSGIFECKLTTADGEDVVEQVVWDRVIEGGFPEAKSLKQRVRDLIQPGRDLGHSEEELTTAKTGRTAFQRILSVILGDRAGNRNDPRTPRERGE